MQSYNHFLQNSKPQISSVLRCLSSLLLLYSFPGKIANKKKKHSKSSRDQITLELCFVFYHTAFITSKWLCTCNKLGDPVSCQTNHKVNPTLDCHEIAAKKEPIRLLEQQGLLEAMWKSIIGSMEVSRVQTSSRDINREDCLWVLVCMCVYEQYSVVGKFTSPWEDSFSGIM